MKPTHFALVASIFYVSALSAHAEQVNVPGAPVAYNRAPVTPQSLSQQQLAAQLDTVAELKALRAVIARDQSAWGDPAALCFIDGKAYSRGAVVAGKRCDAGREVNAPLHWIVEGGKP